MIWNEKSECMPRDALGQVQLERLQATVNRALRNVAFYRESFARSGVNGDEVRALEDLARLPFTTKEDLRASYPYGMFAVPLRDIVRIQSTSGTTGTPVVVGYTRNDLKTWSECVARLLAAGGMSEHDVMQVAFTYGLFSGGFGLHAGAERIGASVIPASTGGLEKQVRIMKDFKTTALACTPSYAMAIAAAVGRDGRVAAMSFFSGPGSSARSRGARRCGRAWSPASGSRRWTTTASPRSSVRACPSSANARTACTSTRTASSPRSSTPPRCGSCPRVRGRARADDDHEGRISAGPLPHRGPVLADDGAVRLREDLRAHVADPGQDGRHDHHGSGEGVPVPDRAGDHGGEGAAAPLRDRRGPGRGHGHPGGAGWKSARGRAGCGPASAQALADLLDMPAKVTLVEPHAIARPEGGKARRVVDKRQI